jgi:L-iditol 2-dehydrogenase
MRVAPLVAHRQFHLVEQAPLPLAAGEVRVEVSHVGICGSDIHYFAEGAIGDVPCVYPMVLGHEPVGRIQALGAGVTGWRVGDPVICEPALYCYHCEFCLAGRHNVCANLRFLSTPAEPGFFRDLVDLPLTNILAVPPGIGLAEGALVEPLAVVLHSMEFAQPQVGETAVVFGCGPIGLLTIAVLKLAGVRRIWAIEPVAFRRDMALAAGADAVMAPSAEAVPSIVRETAGRGVDIAIDCVAKDGSLNLAMHAVCNRGRTVITGIPGEKTVDFEFHVMRRKELFFYNVRRSNHDSHRALALLTAHPKLMGGILTHHRPFDAIQSAFETLERVEDGVGKMVLDLN